MSPENFTARLNGADAMWVYIFNLLIYKSVWSDKNTKVQINEILNFSFTRLSCRIDFNYLIARERFVFISQSQQVDKFYMNSKEHVEGYNDTEICVHHPHGKGAQGKFRTADVMISHACRSWALRGNLVLLFLVVIFALPRGIVIGTAMSLKFSPSAK